jgi:hypothetical protein
MHKTTINIANYKILLKKLKEDPNEWRDKDLAFKIWDFYQQCQYYYIEY